MDEQRQIKRINESLRNTMTSAIGIKITGVRDEYICSKMPVDERTIQPFGLLHGGASVVLAETLGSIAGNRMVNMETEMVVGVEINANHLRSVKDGWVYGKADPIRIGKKIQVWEIQITNETSELVCISRLTLAVVRKR